MASSFDGNCSSYWSYSPYPYCNSYDTSSSNSSYFESPISSSSPRMMMFPVYDQQPPPPCYYYADPIPPCHQFIQSSPPIVPSSQVNNLIKHFIFLIMIFQIAYIPSSSPPIPRSSPNLPNRLQYTIRQRWLLNEIFEHVPYPNSIQKNVIADRIGATREQIRKFIFHFKQILFCIFQVFGFKIVDEQPYKIIVYLPVTIIHYLLIIIIPFKWNWNAF